MIVDRCMVHVRSLVTLTINALCSVDQVFPSKGKMSCPRALRVRLNIIRYLEIMDLLDLIYKMNDWTKESNNVKALVSVRRLCTTGLEPFAVLTSAPVFKSTPKNSDQCLSYSHFLEF